MRALILTCCAVLGLGLTTPATEYSRRVWRTTEGLPQSKIQCFAQTADGYLWIGTSGGLVRFDGSRFTVFDRSSTPALRDDSVLSLLTARDGSLWIGTEGGGLAHMRDGAFQSYGAPDGLTNGFVRALLEDSRGRLWIGTDRGFFRFEKGRFLRLDGKNGSPVLAAHSLLEDSSGNIWVGTSFGLFRMAGAAMVQPAGAPPSVRDITSIFETADHDLWLASVSGLRRVAAGKLATDPQFAAINARRILRDHSGNVWVGTASGGLIKFSGGTTSKLTEATLTAPDPLPDNSVLALFEDLQRNLWVGTQDGLLRLTETSVRTFNSKDGLSEDNVGTVYADPGGTMWLATMSGGLYRMNGERPVKVPPPSADPTFPARNIYVDREGVRWIGSTIRGFLRVAHDGVRSFTMSDGLRSNGIRGFLEDRDGTMWIATGSGLSHWDGKTIRSFYLEDGLSYGGLRVLALDTTGDLLVGTDGGINRMRQSRFVRDPAFEQLGNERVWAILPDANGVLWLGTRGDGLLRLQGAKITRYTTREGLPSNSIFQILDDGAGRLWMSSASGVFSAERGELEAVASGRVGALSVIPYDTDDGMLSSQMNGGAQAAGCRDTSGNLWFPSVKGAVRINAKQSHTLPSAPVLIESLRVDEREMPISGGGISIAPGSNRLEVDFTSPDLAAPDRVSFRYMLEGFDKTWIPALQHRTAYYTNLPPRHFRFRVIAQEVAQPHHTSEASLLIDLRPRFYQAVWFYVIAAAASALIILLVLRLYARQTKGRYALVLAERTRLAREMHDTVIQGCVGVSTLLEAARSLPPEAASRAKDLIDRAASQIRLTVNEAREAVWDLRHSTIEHGVTRTLQDFAEQVSESEGIAVETVIEGASANMEEEAGRNLLLVTREAVRNAVMHGAAKRIGVKLQFNPAEVCLEVRDNGCGFRQEQPRVDGHYGIVGMRERVEQSGGSFELHSVPGTGTRVVARFPLRSSGARNNGRA